MVAKRHYIRALNFLLLTTLTAVQAFSAFAAEDEMTVAGAEAHIYHVYCEQLPANIRTKKGYGLVLAAIKTNGYVTQTLVFSAKLKKIRSLCDNPWDSSYQKRRVDIDNFMPATGGDIVSISDPTIGV